MKIAFVKMEGLGNDYVFVDCLKNPAAEKKIPKIAARLSAPHFGIGSDGVIAICRSKQCHVRMRIFNADGSEGRMCGNGIRCVAKYVWDSQITAAVPLSVETLAGTRHVWKAGRQYRVDMGRATVSGTDVDIGNPHKVFFYDNVDGLDIKALAAPYPDRNVEFVQIMGKREIRVRVFERGSGETMACGTGACAAAVAAVAGGKIDGGRAITVHLPGGSLTVEIENANHVFMTGAAKEVFRGEINA